MIGIEITINNEAPIRVSCPRGLINVSYYTGEDCGYFRVSGITSEMYHVIWVEKEILRDCRIKVKTIETDESIGYLRKYILEPQDLLRKYNDLKQTLIEKGLLSPLDNKTNKSK